MKKINYFRYVLLPAFIALFFIVYSCKENNVTPDEATGVIAGQILDEQDVPVPGAIIQVFSSGAGVQGLFGKDTTDEEGYFSLSDIPENQSDLQVRIDHEDFASFDIALAQMTKDQDKKKVGVKIQHDTICTGILSFNIVDADNNPIKEAEIRLNRGDKIIRKSYTNEDGNLIFDNVCPGSYWVRIAKYGFRVIEEEFSIEQGDTLNMPMEMMGLDQDTCCNGVINFDVKDSATQQAMKEVRVKLYQGSEKINEGYTGEDGRFKFEKVCEGNYQISFLREGYKAQEFNFEVACNDTVEFSKLMAKLPPPDSCCNGVIQLIVKDSATNEGVSLARVNLWFGEKKIKEGKTSETGAVSFTGLCEGKYGFSISRDGYKSIEFNIELTCDDTLESTRNLVKMESDSCCDGVIEIEVIDSETKEIVNLAKVNLWKGGKLLKYQKTEAGKVRFTDLCLGEYGIDIIREQYKTIEFTVTLECNKTVNLTKEIVKITEEKDSCCNGVIYVSPRDSETKEIISGSVVKLWFGDKMVYQETCHGEPLMIKNLCEGKYQFTFIADGYKSVEEDFVLACNDTMEFPFYMQKSLEDSCCDGSIKVFALDKESGESIKGAIVKLWKDGKVVGERKVEGEYVIFENLCKGKYSGSIIAEGYKGIEYSIELGCNEQEVLEKTLEKTGGDDCCEGKLTIKPVKDGSDEIIKGAIVKLWKDGKLLAKKTVENSAVVFENLCQGNYGVEIEHGDYQAVEFDFELGCNEDKTIEKGMKQKDNSCCKGVIFLHLKDSTNNSSLANVNVYLYKGSTKVAAGKTNEDGYLKFENVCEGKHSFGISKDGYNGREAGIEVGCNDTLEFTYKMLKKEAIDTCYTAEVALIVKDKDTEERLANVLIKVYDKGGKVVAEGYTDEEGRFNKNALKAPTAYKFSGTKDGYKSAYVIVEWAKCEKKEAVLLLQSE